MMQFVRGDSFLFKVLLGSKGDEPINQNLVQTLYITFRKYANIDSDIIFQKTLSDVRIDDDGYCHASFLPEDTEDLAYGKYFFDIEVTLTNGYRKSRLYEVELTKETTIHEMAGENNG